MEATLDVRRAPESDSAAERRAVSETVTLSVPDMVCGNCIRTVEMALQNVEGVAAARANLSSRRIIITFEAQRVGVEDLVSALAKAGYKAGQMAEGSTDEQAAHTSDLLPRVGVAGFAAANIMLLSVSVWSGQASDMDPSVTALFHWISALIALPAVAYAGQPFFRSAIAALRGRRLNMDVPISLGITLACGMSLFQTIRGSEQVYFDAAAMLVFFLLIGRTLDERMRARARGAAENLLSLKALSATVIEKDGASRAVAARSLTPGMRIAIAAGERVAADGVVTAGVSEIDESLITGETVPRAVRPGDRVHAGTVNGGGPLQIDATATIDNTLLAEIGRLMLAAEQSRGRYVRLADRAASFYAPAVHILGAATFTGWMLIGSGWEPALTHAIAVLIITCPCALALAVPAVQLTAIGRLFNQGVIIKAADGLERLAEVDTVVFDKTGTLTLEQIRLADAANFADDTLSRAASLAVASRHPYAQAVVRAARDRNLKVEARDGVQEVPGSGLSVVSDGREERLGSALWVGNDTTSSGDASLWYRRDNEAPIGFRFADRLRSDAREIVNTLLHAGYEVELLSGDRAEAVARAAEAASISAWRAATRPDQKLARLNELRSLGRSTLMVGDGLNDAPALAAGHASLSPASAVEISQTAADAVFQGEKLWPVVQTLMIARAAQRMALQNFAIAIAYNAVFVPLAILGHVTPLIAALAMSTSSILVTANAVRLRTMKLHLAPLRRYP
jgi:Cu2+-exporting ATPase